LTASFVSGATAVWVDGVSAQSLPLPDRGLDFGDGLFETLLLRGDTVLFSNLHLQRLKRGLEALYFPACLAEVTRLLEAAAAAIGVKNWRWSALRITVTRGSGPRGYGPPSNPKPRIIMVATELGPDYGKILSPASLTLSSVRWPTQPALAGLKHLNRLEQVIAAREYRLAGADEALMLNQSGQPISVVAGSLFLHNEGCLITAPLGDCGIAGTRRELIMRRWGPALGLAIEETVLTPQQVEDADEVFYSNSLVGLRPVASFGGRSWATYEICEALYGQYQEEIG
jgi:4-amino-4-deoxychorismate lyase